MKKSDSPIYVFLIYFFLILIPFVLKILLFPKLCQDFYSIWVLITTGGVIVWYSWETRELKKETQKSGEETRRLGEEIHLQTELQLLPILYIEMTHDNISVFNCGNSPALNIDVIIEPDLSNSQHGNFLFEFNKIIFSGILIKNDGGRSFGFFRAEDEDIKIVSVKKLFDTMRKYNVSIKIKCENIQKKKYIFYFKAPEIKKDSLGDTQPHELLFNGYETIK